MGEKKKPEMPGSAFIVERPVWFTRRSYLTKTPEVKYPSAKPQYHRVVEKITVSKLLLEYLALEGVDTVFGIPGKGVNQLSVDMAYAQQGAIPGLSKIRFVISRHDGGAAFMADGYARVSGKLGVCMVTSGPGASNAATGIMVAHVDRSSVMLLSGEVSETIFGRGGFQEGVDSGVNMPGVYQNMTQLSVMISSPDAFQTLFTQAIRTATALPRHAVAVSLPLNISTEVIPKAHIPSSRENYVVTAKGVDPVQVKDAFEKLQEAERPLLFLGSGAREALIAPDDPVGSRKRLEDFTEYVVKKHVIPVMTSPRAKGIFPESHEYSLRNFGLAACEWPRHYLLQGYPQEGDPESGVEAPGREVLFPEEPRYDALLVIGTSLKQWTTNSWDPALVPLKGPFMQVDLDATVIARNFPVEIGIVANARVVIDQLIELGKNSNPKSSAERRRLFLQRLKEFSPWREPEKRNSTAVPVLPQRLTAEFQRVLDTAKINGQPLKTLGANIFLDVGNVLGWSWHELIIDPPLQLWSNTGMGAMGWGIGAAIGGKLAAPDKPCMVITGDGAFLMNGAEISTAYQQALGITWIVFEDNNLRMVAQGIAHDFPVPPPGTTWFDNYQLGNADLEAFARGLGADTYRVSKPGDLESLLPEILQRGEATKRPQVIIASIDTKEEPPYQYLLNPTQSDSR